MQQRQVSLLINITSNRKSYFVAKLDEEKKIFNFKKVLMINPALNIYDSAIKLDQMLVDNVPGGMKNFNTLYQWCPVRKLQIKI